MASPGDSYPDPWDYLTPSPPSTYSPSPDRRLPFTARARPIDIGYLGRYATHLWLKLPTEDHSLHPRFALLCPHIVLGMRRCGFTILGPCDTYEEFKRVFAPVIRTSDKQMAPFLERVVRNDYLSEDDTLRLLQLLDRYLTELADARIDRPQQVDDTLARRASGCPLMPTGHLCIAHHCNKVRDSILLAALIHAATYESVHDPRDEDEPYPVYSLALFSIRMLIAGNEQQTAAYRDPPDIVDMTCTIRLVMYRIKALHDELFVTGRPRPLLTFAPTEPSRALQQPAIKDDTKANALLAMMFASFAAMRKSTDPAIKTVADEIQRAMNNLPDERRGAFQVAPQQVHDIPRPKCTGLPLAMKPEEHWLRKQLEDMNKM